jgi:hypothetical protein
MFSECQLRCFNFLGINVKHCWLIYAILDQFLMKENNDCDIQH